VSTDPRRARDLRLLDGVDAHPRAALEGTLWRVSREGRDPLQGGRSASRWCNGEFDVLYTSLERDGALAEVHTLLALQPVFPSRISFRVHRLRVAAQSVLHLADLPLLEQLGVDTARYQDRDYRQTQDIADATFFLGFDGLVVPSARWSCANAVLFTDRIDPAALTVEATDSDPVNWSEWRRRHRGRRIT
jgi:RES domain-containing protein